VNESVLDTPPAPTPPVRLARRYTVLAAALVAVAVGAVIVAANTDPGRLGPQKVDPQRLPREGGAPDLPVGRVWLNSPPLASADLDGQVVLYDFWTYSCVNCVRTLPYLRAWYDRYRADGLVIVGVHSPEFDFEQSRANVEDATRRLGVTWPVVMDNDLAIWDSFNNAYWPTKYVTDRDGQIRYRHIGEGRYDETEDVLRSLLGVDPASPRALERPTEEPDPASYRDITPETYLGTRRGTAGARPGRTTYPEPPPLATGEARVVGDWEADAHSVTARSPGAAIVLAYRAAEVGLVLADRPLADPIEVVVELDGAPVPPDGRGPDLTLDGSGATILTVDHDGMYRLVRGANVEERTLRLTVRAPGVAAFAFTFGA
jgi:thiol-disulfide isomerase/thioredoxin